MKWVRPGTMVMLSMAVTAGFFLDKIESAAFFGFATGIVVWWLKARDEEKKRGA